MTGYLQVTVSFEATFFFKLTRDDLLHPFLEIMANEDIPQLKRETIMLMKRINIAALITH